jgi:uncharacterized protein
MCGPIVTAASIARHPSHPGSRLRQILGPLTYQLGRITTYILIGAGMGLLGSATGLATTWSPALKGGISLLAAVWMILAGFSLAGILPAQRWIEQAPLAPIGMRIIRSLLTVPGLRGRFALGFANGLLPCGPVAAAAISSASTFSPMRGAIAMGSFGLGTLPAMLAISISAGLLTPPGVRSRFYKAGAVSLLIIGIQLGMRGLHAFGIAPPLRIGSFVIW